MEEKWDEMSFSIELVEMDLFYFTMWYDKETSQGEPKERLTAFLYTTQCNVAPSSNVLTSMPLSALLDH